MLQPAAMLQIKDLSIRIAGRLILDGATATVPEGHHVGLIGRNGAGKTTLFKAIANEIDLETGGVDRPKAWRIGMVEQEAPANSRSLIDWVLDADTERKELLAAADHEQDPARIAEIHTRLADIDAHAAPARAGRILQGLGFDAAAQLRPCSDFSGGWRMRVALAAMLFAEPDLLLLDEPTNYLDLEGVMWLEQYLKRYPKTFLLISHDRDLLNTAVDAILHLHQGKLTLYGGGYDTFEDLRRQKLELEDAARRKQELQRKHLQSFVDRFRYKASKAKQAQSRIKMLARLKPIAEAVADPTLTLTFPDCEELAPPILTVRNASAGYGDRTVLRGLDFRLDMDDRIALLGQNGNGKSTLAKIITKRLAPLSGDITISPKLRIGYFAQHQLDELRPAETAYEHMLRARPHETPAKLRARLGGFGLTQDKADVPASNLSGGEKARLLFALVTLDAPHLLVLDEPTNHLDIDAREALVQALNAFKGAVILISHDRHLLDACADRLWLVAGGKVTPFDGDLEDYRRQVADVPDSGNGKRDKADAAQRRKAAAKARADVAPLKKIAEDAARTVEKLEAERAKLEGLLADPKLYDGPPDRLQKLTREKGELDKRLAAAEGAWVQAESDYEAARQESA